MTAKERVLTAFACREPDRVPINYAANPGIDRRLKAHFGLQPDDDEGLLRALGVDFRDVGAPYRGPKLHEDIPERGIKVDGWPFTGASARPAPWPRVPCRQRSIPVGGHWTS